MLFDEIQHTLGIFRLCDGKPSQERENRFPLAELSARQFAGDVNVSEDFVRFQQGNELLVASP